MRCYRALALVILAASVTWFTGTALAEATLHIGPGAGTACATGCAGEPNAIGGGVVDIFQNSAGAPSITNPLLILAVPNDTTNLNFSISGVTFINPYPGGTTTTGSGSITSFTAGFNGSSGNIYSFLGLAGSGLPASDTFVNFTTMCNGCPSADLTATSFGIYVIQLNGTLGPNGLANITFGGGGLPVGTLAFGYGLVGDKGFGTPWTEAGAVVPEPSSLLLMGTGLLGVGGMLRRRFLF